MLALVEMCIELVLEFEQVIGTLPDDVHTTSLSDVPPILACGGSSIANTALCMLQVSYRPNTVITFDCVMFCICIG